ncbi:MAG: DUF4177 domain-containing protein [Albidovulum sp.]|uniref:DUF4177 domain-containing protein n=1 Tax=Albidovulum sp. TaxID=1872424 RepID=UPI003C9BEA00
MQNYEYKVVPAPNRGEKAPGVKSAPDRFAHALTSLMNTMARDGWDYLRADTLPSEERSGLTKRTTVYHSVLVFRRAIAKPADEAPRKLLTAAAPAGKAPALLAEPAPVDTPAPPVKAPPATPEEESH